MRAIITYKNNTDYKLLDDLDSFQIPTDNNEYLWLDLQSSDKKIERKVLEQKFDISKLAVDDAQRDRHPPKFESFKEYKFLLIKAFDAETKNIDFQILHISFFIHNNYLITVHDGVSPSIDSIWSNIISANKCEAHDPYSLLYLILKKITNRYTKVILGLEERLEEIESKMIQKPSDSLLGELIRYSTSTQYLYRIFNNQDIVVKEMLDIDTNLGRNELKHKFQDIQEHMGRLAGLTGLLNEITKNLIDGYISVTGHRLNNIMKTLTIVALIFMPITFVAGIYGMNFENMPELSYKYGYFITLFIMILIAFGLVALFKKIKWI
jgi:magnesium transporter